MNIDTFANMRAKRNYPHLLYSLGMSYTHAESKGAEPLYESRETKHLECPVCGAIGFSKKRQRCKTRTNNVQCTGKAVWVFETPNTLRVRNRSARSKTPT